MLYVVETFEICHYFKKHMFVVCNYVLIYIFSVLIDDIVLMCERGKFVWLKDDIKDLAKIREHIREAEKEARLELKKNSIGDGTGEGEKIVKNTLLNYFGSN